MAKTKVTGGYIADSAITSDHLHTTLNLSSKTLTIGATTVSGHLIPDTNITYDLGSSTYRFRDIYLDGTTINLGGTELKKNSDGDIEFKSGSNFKRLVVSELEFDDGTNRKKFKISSGRIKSFDSSGASDTADKISLASNTTDDLGEGSSNLYFTTARARGAISASTGIAITDGAISAAAVPNASLTNSSVTINSNSLSLGGTLTLDTDDIGEGSTNLYFTNARARGAISVSGNALSYNSSTGVLTANYEESPTFTGTVTSGAILSSQANNNDIEVRSVGDYFPSFTLARTSGTTKTNYEWNLQIGSSGYLNFKDITNGYYPLIFRNNGDVYLGNNTSAASPVLLLDQSAASATFAGTVIATDLLIDTDVIVTDSTNDRVGINKTSPVTTLDVGGSIYFSGILRGTSDGSASTPTIQPGSDADTGLYRPATNQIGFTTAGTNALTLDASQNATFAGTLQATSFSDGTISGVTFIDEDSFATNSATRVPTQQSIKAYVDAQVAGVVDTAPAALNTLNELAAALGDDANFSTTTSTALGNRLRVDTASQGLTGTQQANAITNLGITATKAELNYVDGVTSNIQTQLNTKITSSDNITGTSAGLSGTPDITVGDITATQLDLRGEAQTSNLDTVGRGLYYWGSTQPSTGSPGFNYGMAWTVTDPNQNIQLAFGSSSAGRIAVRRKDSGTYYDWTHFYGEGTTISGDVSSSYNQTTNTLTLTVADDSHNHVISNVDGLQTALDSKYESGDNVSLGTISSGAITVDPSGTYGDGITINAGDTSTAAQSAKQIIMSFGGSSSIDYPHSIRTRHNSSASTGNTVEFYLWDYGTDSSTTIGTKRALVLENSTGLDLLTGGYKVGGTTIIDSSGNLTNIGTISSGDIITTGIQMGSGTSNDIQADGKTAYIGSAMFGNAASTNVPATAVHIKGSGTPTLRIEDLDSTNQVYDFISNYGVGLSIVDQTSSVTPLAFAHTTGNATFAGTITSGRIFPAGIDLSIDTGLFNQNAAISYYSASNAVYVNGAGPSGWLRLQAAGTENDYDAINIFGSTAGSKIDFRTGNVQRLRISSSGDIQLGSSATTIIDSSGNLTNIGTINSGSITSTGQLQGTTVRIQNTSSTTKYGLSLYGANPTNPTYGIMFTGTSGSGTHGSVTADWATYFTMNSTSGRGWIFRQNTDGTNVASISNTGNATFNGTINSGAITSTGALTLSVDGTDALNFSANSTNDARGISFNGRTALSADYNDGWLRLNNQGEFGNGIYTPANLRVDGGLYITNQILHQGDTNTYMQFHAADQWRVVTGGAERLEVNNTQTTISQTLSVYETGADSLVDVLGNSSYDPVLNLRSDQGAITTEGFQIWYDNSVGDVHLHTTYPNDVAAIRFHTRTGTDKATNNERFAIEGGGDINVVSGALKFGGTERITSTGALHNLNGDIRSDNVFDFLTQATAAQSIKAKSLYVGTTYGGNTSSNGMVQASAGFAVGTGAGGTTIINGSGNITSGSITLSHDSSDMGFGTAKAGSSVGHSASVDEGIFWHTSNDYGIYRTSGTWASPNYQQLKLKWATGIEIDGNGTSYGKSGINFLNGNIKMDGTQILDGSRNLSNIGTIAAGKTVLTGDGTTNTYSSLLKTVNTGSDQWGHITLGGSATNSVTDNYYLIGRGANVSDREMSFHIPNDGNYGDSTQPKFRFASSGSDTLFTVEAETGTAFHKGAVQIGSSNTALSQGTLNALKIQTNSGRLDIGPMNSSFCHVDTDRPQFYFNKKLIVDEGIVSSYDEDLSLQRAQVVKLNLGTDNHNFYGANTAMNVYIGSATQSLYSNLILNTNDGDAQLFKAGSAYSNWGGLDAFNIYCSNGDICLHPSATANILRITSSQVIATRPILTNSTTFAPSPNTYTYLSASELQFGGNNNGKQGDSAQISAGQHQANSLNFVGMGTASSNRRMDFWVEGKAYFRGDIVATGNVTAYGSASDKRLKKDIVKIDNAIDKIKSVSGYEFAWNENAPKDKQNKREFGVIAQEVEEAGLDKLVFEYERPVSGTDEDNKNLPEEKWKAVHYDKFVPILIEGMKEQQELIEKLTARIEELENK